MVKASHMRRTVSYGNIMEGAPRPRRDWKELVCDRCGKSTGLTMNPKAEIRIRGRVFCKDCNGGQGFVGDWWVTLPEMTVKLIPALKAQLFVRHIQRHLKKGEYGSSYYTEGRHIPAGKVGCKICERSIDAIFKLEKIIDAKEKK